MIDYMKKFELKNRVVAVAGGLGLIGKEVSLALAQAGAQVLVLDIDKTKGEQFELECSEQNWKVKFFDFDITQINDFDRKIGEIFNQAGPIHSWINVAYPKTKDWGGKLETVKIESWRKNVEMHMDSYCFTTIKIAELMKENKVKGNILCMFPEGTRRKPGKTIRVKPGLAMIAIKAECPVLPAAIIGKPRLFNKVKVIYGKPIDLSQYYDKELTTEDYIKISELAFLD